MKRFLVLCLIGIITVSLGCIATKEEPKEVFQFQPMHSPIPDWEDEEGVLNYADKIFVTVDSPDLPNKPSGIRINVELKADDFYLIDTQEIEVYEINEGVLSFYIYLDTFGAWETRDRLYTLHVTVTKYSEHGRIRGTIKGSVTYMIHFPPKPKGSGRDILTGEDVKKIIDATEANATITFTIEPEYIISSEEMHIKWRGIEIPISEVDMYVPIDENATAVTYWVPMTEEEYKEYKKWLEENK